MEETQTDKAEEPLQKQKFYIPTERLGSIIIVQSCIIGLLFYLIGQAYFHINILFSVAFQWILCPLSMGIILYLSWKQAKLPSNKKILKNALKALAIIITILLILCILGSIFMYVITLILKNGNSGGGNPWL